MLSCIAERAEEMLLMAVGEKSGFWMLVYITGWEENMLNYAEFHYREREGKTPGSHCC